MGGYRPSFHLVRLLKLSQQFSRSLSSICLLICLSWQTLGWLDEGWMEESESRLLSLMALQAPPPGQAAERASKQASKRAFCPNLPYGSHSAFLYHLFFYAYWLCRSPLLFRNNQMLIAQFKWTIKYVRTLCGDGADKRAGARQSATFNSQPSGGANLIIIQSSPKIRAIQLNILINLKYQANDANYKYPQESRLDERLGSRLILQPTVS